VFRGAGRDLAVADGNRFQQPNRTIILNYYLVLDSVDLLRIIFRTITDILFCELFRAFPKRFPEGGAYEVAIQGDHFAGSHTNSFRSCRWSRLKAFYATGGKPCVTLKTGS